MRITYKASDPKLAKRIADYGDKLESLETTAQAISEPVALTDDEFVAMTTESLLTQREALLSERLKHRQDRVHLARERIELLEEIEVEWKAAVDKSDKAFEAIHSKTAKGLEKNGMGLKAQPAFRTNPVAAQRQFEHVIRSSQLVHAKDNERSENRRRLAHAIQQTVNARDELAQAEARLRNFIYDTFDFLKGTQHGTETTNTGEPYFSAQRISAR